MEMLPASGGSTPPVDPQQFDERPVLPERVRRPDDEPLSRDGSLTVPARGVRAWYLLAYSRDVRRGHVLARTLHGREIVLYRGTSSGRVFAVSAHCSHMGTHLRHGDVHGDEVRCALHHWRFAGDTGACTHATACDSPPTWAKQRAFPVRERFGAIFVHNGPAPTTDVPGWDGVDEERSVHGHIEPLHIRAPWTSIACNAWDGVHLTSVHQRTCRQPPRVTYPDPYACRLSWHADVAGRHLADRVTARIAGSHGVRAHITNHGGVVLVIESRVGRMSPSRLMLGLDPQPDGTTVIRAVFPVDRVRVPGVAPLRMRIQRRLFRRFLQPDVDILSDIRYRPRTPLPADEPLQQVMEFLDALPAAT